MLSNANVVSASAPPAATAGGPDVICVSNTGGSGGTSTSHS